METIHMNVRTLCPLTQLYNSSINDTHTSSSYIQIFVRFRHKQHDTIETGYDIIKPINREGDYITLCKTSPPPL
ncbi:hypothetical protein XELAEV_18020236mg [Xenopus laevis]|uniref:Uncharacterized protein n=1 Tax=Xenopus laevis TaxID=8355 RepID=A0A974HQV4_XENLA|nr:hypothetical protein XELAEV_18020236mg [Xenopus laevis]